MNPSLLLISQAGFVVLTVVYFSLLLQQLFRGVALTTWDEKRKKVFKVRWIGGLLLWALFVGVWSSSGMMSDFTFFPLNFVPVIAAPLIVILFVTFSASMRDVLQRIPAENLIRLQTFRFFVELLLWALFIANIVPVQMTFEGRNFDILSGITAPLVAWLVAYGKLSRTATIIWNLLCLVLLVNIVAVAIMSTPTPVRVFMNEPANTIVTYFPVSLLPGFLVPLAYMLHFFSLRQLAIQKSSALAA